MSVLLCALLLLQAAPAAETSPPPTAGGASMQARDPPQHADLELGFDPAASHASFTVHTRWLSAMVGRFDAPEGTLDTLPDGRLLECNDAFARMLGYESRDGEVRSQNGQFASSLTAPASLAFYRKALLAQGYVESIRFRSEPFSRARLSAGGALDGLLELRGVNKPVRFVLAKSDCAQAGVGCPIHAAGRISRRAFGMTQMLLLVRDNVEFAFDARLQAQP